MGSNPVFCTIFFGHEKTRMAANEVDLEIEDGCIKETESSSYYIWQYFTVSNSSDPKKEVQKLQSASFVTKPSVAAVLRGQQPTFWDVLY